MFFLDITYYPPMCGCDIFLTNINRHKCTYEAVCYTCQWKTSITLDPEDQFRLVHMNHNNLSLGKLKIRNTRTGSHPFALTVGYVEL